MILLVQNVFDVLVAFPRIGGGDPLVVGIGIETIIFSPHRRG